MLSVPQILHGIPVIGLEKSNRVTLGFRYVGCRLVCGPVTGLLVFPFLPR